MTKAIDDWKTKPYGRVMDEKEMRKRTHWAHPYCVFDPGAPVDMDKVDELMKGGIDVHIHGAPQAMDPEKSGAIVKMCADAVDIPVIFKATLQCVDQAAVSRAVVEAGAAAITANNTFYGTWIDPEAAKFYGGPHAVGCRLTSSGYGLV